MKSYNKTNKIFKFSEDEARSLFEYNLKLVGRIGSSFDYVFEKMEKLGHHISGDNPKLSKDKFREGKNYHWSSLKTDDNIQMLFRQYGQHLTVYTCRTTPLYDGDTLLWTETNYSSFTFHVETSKITREDVIEGIPQPDESIKWVSDYYSDYFYDEPFLMFNIYLPEIIQHVRKGNEWLISNSSSIKVPKFVDIKMIFHGNTIDSYDNIIYCAEELSNTHICLFAENEMLEAIKQYNVGDTFGKGFEEGTITKVATDVKDDAYYHCGLGMKLKHNGKDKWIDVYSLTQYYIRYFFPELEEK